MEMHLQDFLGQHPWLLWLSLIPLLVAAELLWRRRVFLSWTVAVVVGAVLAAVAPWLWWLQLLGALGAGMAAHRWIRPWLLRRLPEPRAVR
ncbi:MAG TPA: hypothetical protein IAA98_07005 [Candidatus Avipropionibacterium avicola]|uniref:Uncharacterized protein n=1 Tax=Candidatus Avipropionibacterium avicola TaxID=2840701 RepID=A0A9D1GXN5_9ACTN|nr:hypothetical protein [Candidatus Avipropionibacterium avicola]